MRVSIFDSGKLVTIVEAFDLADAQAGYPGCTVAEAKDTDVPVSQPVVATLTAQQFRDRFTDTELVAMLASSDPGVKLLVLKIQTADPFPMDRPSVQQGLDYLVAKGILTSQRRAVIGTPTSVL